MIWFTPLYELRKNWGHTVRLAQPEFKSTDFGTTVDPDEQEEIINWAIENSQGRRISYDTWQFKNKQDAETFIMIFKLMWGA